MSKSRITIDLAKGCGFCAGVRRAVQMAEEAAKKHGRVTMLGDIVHNETVIKELAGKGVNVVSSPDEIPEEVPILLRAHGTTPAVEDELYGRGLTVLDATCPLVREIHKVIRELEKEGRRCLIVGDQGHDEVVGIAGQVHEAVVIATPEEARKLSTMKKAGVISQSTQTQADLRVVNTICAPSRLNQREAERVARENELVIVIGSDTSANTKRLVEVVRRLNSNVIRIASADELDIEALKSVQSIGITAGASTPDAVIRDVIHTIQTI